MCYNSQIRMYVLRYKVIEDWGTGIHGIYRMAGNFGGKIFGVLLKICHLAEFTLAVESGLAIMIFIAKWLTERAGNLTGP